jgi:predicted DNA-binding transcriptional regulator YafY
MKDLISPRDSSSGKAYHRAFFRLCQIHREIAAGNYPNAGKIAELLEIHPRTAKRDIQFLKNEYHAPLIYDGKKRGYRYAEPGWSLPLAHLSEGEMLAFFIAENALRFTGNTPYAKQLKNAISKIATMLPEQISVNLATLGENVRFQQLPFVSVEPEILQVLARASINQEPIEFDYFSPHSQAQTHRIADVHLLHNFIGDWYAVSFDREKQDFRDFNIGRMKNLKLTGDYFEIQKGWNAEEYLRKGFYMMRGGKLTKIQIWFDPYQSQWIRERNYFHPDEQREELADGSIRLSFEVGENGLEAVARFCLTYAGNCIAEKPEKLKEIVNRKLKQALELNK